MCYPKEKPLGVILVSPHDSCSICSSKLLVRKDRPSSIVVYDDHIGAVPGTHYHKYCKYCCNRVCGYTQFYGYHTIGGETLFDTDGETLPYFVSSFQTVFAIGLIKRFTSQILLGQMSFKQCADVYNHLHQSSRYDSGNKP